MRLGLVWGLYKWWPATPCNTQHLYSFLNFRFERAEFSLSFLQDFSLEFSLEAVLTIFGLWEPSSTFFLPSIFFGGKIRAVWRNLWILSGIQGFLGLFFISCCFVLILCSSWIDSLSYLFADILVFFSATFQLQESIIQFSLVGSNDSISKIPNS